MHLPQLDEIRYEYTIEYCKMGDSNQSSNCFDVGILDHFFVSLSLSLSSRGPAREIAQNY